MCEVRGSLRCQSYGRAAIVGCAIAAQSRGQGDNGGVPLQVVENGTYVVHEAQPGEIVACGR